MAFTKIAAAGIGSTGTITLENVVVTGSVNASSITGAASTANIKTDSLVVSGVSTLGNTIVGGGTTQLIVNGNACITGILTIGTSSVTLDGTNNKITVGSATTLDSTGFVGSGANLTAINASNLGSGTIPDARFPATLPAVSGANLTTLNASNLGSGTIPDARFPATLPAVSGANLTGIAAFAVGTLMLFQQTAAPTGWTKQTTHNDKSLRVVSGNASSGGTTAFTSVFASRTPSGSIGNTTDTGTVGSTTLSTSQIPSHAHTQQYYVPGGGLGTGANVVGGQGMSPTVSAWFNNLTTANAGSGGSHNHSLTMNAHNHSFTGSAMDFAVQYVDLIIASKD